MKRQDSKDRPIVEAVLESGELIVDVLMHGDVLADIPFIGTAIKWCKAKDSIKDYAFASKLAQFVQNLEGISQEQRNGLKEKMNAGTEEAQKIGETLFFVLERVTDLDKPSLLAKIFLAYVDEIITGEELRRLCQAVDTAFSDDLQQLIDVQLVPPKSAEPWMQHLVASGLTRLRGAQTIDDISNHIYCEITPLGKALRIACAYQHTENTQL